MTITVSRSCAAALSALVLSSLLTGCETPQTAPVQTEKAEAGRFDDGTYGFMLNTVPRIEGARALKSVTTLQALQGEGVYLFNDAEESNIRVGQKNANGAYAVIENFPKGQEAHGFVWGTNLQGFVRNGAHVSMASPRYLRETGDGYVLMKTEDSDSVPGVKVKLWAFDVSGEYVYHYLRTQKNYPTAAAGVTTAKFPEGSVVYMPQVMLTQDEYIVPKPNAFTGANTVEGFARNFGGKIPYCLSYLPREGYTPYGVLFDASKIPASKPVTTYKTVEKVRTVKDKKGRKVQQKYTTKVAVTTDTPIPETGPVNVLPVKTGTVFCQSTSSTPAATGTYRVATLDGTKGMSFDFPNKVLAPDTGVFELSRDAMRLALVELNRSSGVTVVPGYRVSANRPITDFQYRFNAKAAAAVRQAVKDAKAELQMQQAVTAKK